MNRIHWPRVLGLIVAPLALWACVTGAVYLLVTWVSP